ncbi:class I SAM-dependent methyltransferase, partial [bacterium]
MRWVTPRSLSRRPSRRSVSGRSRSSSADASRPDDPNPAPETPDPCSPGSGFFVPVPRVGTPMIPLLLMATMLQTPKYERRANHDPDGTGTFYMGREIAQFMSHEAAGWLDRPERDAEEAPRRLLATLGLRPGMTIADVGAGSGYLTFPMARAVGKNGKVYAVDIQPEMLTIIRNRAKRAKIANVTTVLGTEDDPRLPAGSTDLMLLVDVYHELGRPYEMGRNMVRGLKRGGKLVLVE